LKESGVATVPPTPEIGEIKQSQQVGGESSNRHKRGVRKRNLKLGEKRPSHGIVLPETRKDSSQLSRQKAKYVRLYSCHDNWRSSEILKRDIDKEISWRKDVRRTSERVWKGKGGAVWGGSKGCRGGGRPTLESLRAGMWRPKIQRCKEWVTSSSKTNERRKKAKRGQQKTSGSTMGK